MCRFSHGSLDAKQYIKNYLAFSLMFLLSYYEATNDFRTKMCSNKWYPNIKIDFLKLLTVLIVL